MLQVRQPLIRHSWSNSSARFMRDVLCSVIATGVASLAFSQWMHEPAQAPSAPAQAGKAVERLAYDAEALQPRASSIAEAVAMFALPQADARTWSEWSVPAAAEVTTARTAMTRATPALPRFAQVETDKKRRAAHVPAPSRPVPDEPGMVQTAQLEPKSAPAREPAPMREPVRVLGWEIPGGNVLASGREAIETVAALGIKAGSKVASLGEAAVETIGWR